MRSDGTFTDKYDNHIIILYCLLGTTLLFFAVMICYYMYKYKYNYNYDLIGSSINYPYHITNILLSVGFMSLFLCIFFFTYMQKVELNFIINNTQYIMQNIFKSSNIIPPYVITTLKTDLAQYSSTLPDDNDIIINNDKIKNRGIIIFVTVFICMLIISIILIYWNNLNFMYIFAINILMTGCVILGEYVFATFIMSNFIIIDNNNIIYSYISYYLRFYRNISVKDIFWGDMTASTE